MEKLEHSLQDNHSLRAKVFKEIEKAILDGIFSPGDNLIEQKLSNELGVSRTPVREALRQLELEGLVETIPNKGAVVIGVTQKDIDDIYTIRMHIEGLAAGWAATNITDEELQELKEIGIGILFEKENINTLDAKGEVLFTILSFLAQDESRSISENSTWGIRRRFETGKHKMSTKRFLGYDCDEKGKLIVNSGQAKSLSGCFRNSWMERLRIILSGSLNGKGW